MIQVTLSEQSLEFISLVLHYGQNRKVMDALNQVATEETDIVCTFLRSEMQHCLKQVQNTSKEV